MSLMIVKKRHLPLVQPPFPRPHRVVKLPLAPDPTTLELCVEDARVDAKDLMFSDAVLNSLTNMQAF